LVSHGAWDAGSFLAATLERHLSSPPSFLLIAFSFPLRHFDVSCAPAVATSRTVQARPPSATRITVLDMARSPPWRSFALITRSKMRMRAKHFFLNQSLASGREARPLDVREDDTHRHVRVGRPTTGPLAPEDGAGACLFGAARCRSAGAALGRRHDRGRTVRHDGDETDVVERPGAGERHPGRRSLRGPSP